MERIDGDGERQRDDRQRGVSIAALNDRPGLLISDSIERHQFKLHTAEPVSPKPADPNRFWFPTDVAARIRTNAIALPTVIVVYVRDDQGAMLAEAEHLAHEEFPEGTYSIELCAPMKLYLRVEGSVTVAADTAQTHITFGEDTDVYVGARSHHKHPAATVTTTAEPRDVMRAVSTFGSALKTTSVERSYPTLRGHPPLLELGDALDIPNGLAAPDTGVRLELPPDYRHIYVGTPLAYYFGAEVVPGRSPRIVCDTGFEHELDAIGGFENEVQRVLKQAFFFDCITRTEGYYAVDLHERREVEKIVDIDFTDLYDRSLAEQLETYLDVPYHLIDEYVPEWKLTTHIAPRPENIELLPFVTNDLAVVHTPQTQDVSSSAVQTAAAGEFFRDSFTRSAASDGGTSTDRSYVQPETTDSLEQAWVGEGTPLGASKATPKAYHNRLSRTLAHDDIGFTVVCNDPEMMEESDVVDAVYGTRDELPFDIELYTGLTRAKLRDLLQEHTDFFHYIGHIDTEGFECVDGKFDATTLERVGVDSFLLNACQSYEQGEHLIEAGAIGGIATLSEVINSGAVRMGKMLARLLNRGFTLRSALTLARDESVIGQQYTVVGDGGLSLVQAESGPPNVCVISETAAGYDLEYKTYPTDKFGMGSLVIPYVENNDQYYLSSGTAETFQMSRVELEEFLSLESVPVKVDGELRWTDDLSIEDI